MTDKSRLSDFPVPMQGALAYWSVLRDLGFESEDIYVGLGTVDDTPDIVHIVLARGELRFLIGVDQMPGTSQERFAELWGVLCAAMHASQKPERMECFGKFPIGSDKAFFGSLVEALCAKGMTPPVLAGFFSFGQV